jgi:NodT family efflux transporter outer membrane factor (OMF) lipoprotein
MPWPPPARRNARSTWEQCVRRRLTPAALFASLVCQGGCITTGPHDWLRNGLKVGPAYSPPLGPVAAEWIQAGDPNVQATQLPHGDWWNVFGDPVLSNLIHAAYAQNPDLLVAGARVLEARAGQAISVGNMFPQSQQAFGTYSRVNLNSNMPVIDKLVQSMPGLPTSFSNWAYGFNLSWELDLWGRIRRNIETANASLDASVEDYDAALVTLFADVASNYVQYRVAQQRIKIAQDNVRTQERILALASEKFRVGTATRLDVEQARSVLEQTRSTIPELEIQLGRASDTQCTLLGIPPRDLQADLGPGPALGSSPIPNTPAVVAAGIPADLLRRRPDVRSAERQVAAQSAQIGVAEADLYPTIFINGTLGWDAEDFSNSFSGKSVLGLLTPGFRWNILNYGRVLNNIRLQQARTLELVAAYQSKVLSAGREAQIPLRGFLKSHEQAEDLARSVTAATAATEVGVAQYRTGTVDFNRVFNLITTQLQQQDRLAIAQGDIALNLISVYRAIGGGWELRLQEHQGSAAPAAHETIPAPPREPAVPLAYETPTRDMPAPAIPGAGRVAAAPPNPPKPTSDRSVLPAATADRPGPDAKTGGAQ